MTLETIAIPNVRYMWNKGLKVRAEYDRSPIWTELQRSILRSLADHIPLADRDEPPATILQTLETLAFRGLIKPGPGRIELTNLGHAEVSTHSPIQAQKDFGAQP